MTAFMTSWKPCLKNELNDLLLFVILSISIPIIWFLFFHWRPNQSAGGNDAINLIFPYIKDLAQHKGNWQEVLYRPELLGGLHIVDRLGSLPIDRLTTYLGFSPVTCLNTMIFVIQILFAYLSTRTAIELGRIWRADEQVVTVAKAPQKSKMQKGQKKQKALKKNDAEAPSLNLKVSKKTSLDTLLGWIGTGLICSFSPVLAWRLGYGHYCLVAGTFIFLGVFSLFVLARNNHITITSLLIIILAFCHAFQGHGHQTVVYSVIFGFPFGIAALALIYPDLKSMMKKCLIPFAAIAAAFCISLPIYWLMYRYAAGSDAARAIGDQGITYSYLISTLLDWISSLPWFNGVVLTGREQYPFTIHEINYPLGPFLLFFLLSPWLVNRQKTKWFFLATVFIGMFLILCFSMNISPFSEMLLNFFHILNVFRVPARAVLPFAILIPIVGCGALLAKIPCDSEPSQSSSASKKPYLLILAFPIIAFLPAAVCETLLWVYAALLLFYLLKNKKLCPIWAGSLFLIFFGVCSVKAFSERLLTYSNEHSLIGIPESIRNDVFKTAPQLSSALTRAHLAFVIDSYQLNTGYPLGISTINGYLAPPKKFIDLFSALAGVEPSYINIYFDINLDDERFVPLRYLYNVAYNIVLNANGSLMISSLGPTLGEAWFSKSIVKMPYLSELAHTLIQNRDDLLAYTKDNLVVVGEEKEIQDFKFPASFSPDCEHAQILSIHAPHWQQNIDLKVQTQADCPMTISLNYVHALKAVAKNQANQWQEIPLFPSYGALVGLVVPKNTTAINIFVSLEIPTWIRVIQFFGFFLMLGIVISSWVHLKSL